MPRCRLEDDVSDLRDEFTAREIRVIRWRRWTMDFARRFGWHLSCGCTRYPWGQMAAFRFRCPKHDHVFGGAS